jgi:hypothetical protein
MTSFEYKSVAQGLVAEYPLLAVPTGNPAAFLEFGIRKKQENERAKWRIWSANDSLKCGRLNELRKVKFCSEMFYSILRFVLVI